MKKMIYSAALVCTLMLGACSDTENYSPQEVLNEALKDSSELTSYYGEYKTEMTGEESFITKHWSENGQARIETIDTNNVTSVVVNDGQSVTSYTEQEKVAYRFSLGGETDGFVQPTMREQAQNLLELVQDTHEISMGDSEKIAGYDTYHLIAKAKDDTSLIGDTEIWVEKKTWMILKSISRSGEIEVISEFTKFEPNIDVEDTLFALELPADVTIEENEVEAPTQLSLEQATELVGPFLTILEQNGWSLEYIEDMKMDETKEIALTYTKNEEPAITLSVFKPAEALDITGDMMIRGQQAELMDESQFRLLQWDEGGLRYSIIFDNLDITVEEVKALTETMALTQ